MFAQERNRFGQWLVCRQPSHSDVEQVTVEARLQQLVQSNPEPLRRISSVSGSCGVFSETTVLSVMRCTYLLIVLGRTVSTDYTATSFLFHTPEITIALDSPTTTGVKLFQDVAVSRLMGKLLHGR